MGTPTRRRGVLSRLVRGRQRSCEPSPKGSGPAGLEWDRFHVDAREAISLAEGEARALHHHYLGTEHVLLGLIRTEHGVASRVLAAIGAELEPIRTAVRDLVGEAPPTTVSDLRPTERTKKVLELAALEAKSRHSPHVRSEHLLLGLAREGAGLGARILADRGAGYEQLRGRVDRAGWECSFCGRNGLEVAYLVAGPGVFICGRCTDAAGQPEPEAPLSLVAGRASASCSFCGKRQAEVERLVTAGPTATICEGCLALCGEIQEEQRQAFIPGRG